MAIASFAPLGSITLSATPTSSNAAIPTTSTPTVALVTNLGQSVVFVAMGLSGVVATVSNLPVMPGQQIALTIGSNTVIAAITLAGVARVNITVGN